MFKRTVFLINKTNLKFLLMGSVIFLLVLIPLKIHADDCQLAILKVKVFEKMEEKRHTKTETYSASWDLNAEGHVMFLVGQGIRSIISKNLSGSSSKHYSRETGCVIHKGSIKGTLTEHDTKKDGGYWKINYDGYSSVKPIKGCMQESIPPIRGTEEKVDFRFSGIVSPSIGKLTSLCQTVKTYPDLGFCNETSQGFSGQMIRYIGIQGGGSIESRGSVSNFTGNEIYEWEVKKVPCECSASIISIKGDVMLNGMPIKEKTKINLSGAVIETVGRSQVKIQTEEGTFISINPKTKLDLSGLCKQIKEEANKPRILKVIEGSFNFVLHKIRVGLEYIMPPHVIKQSTAVVGVRGSLDKSHILLAISENFAQDSPCIIAKKIETEIIQSELEIDSEEIKRADIALFYDFNPEEYYFLIKVIKGKVKIIDSDGHKRYLKSGEKFYRKWTKPSEFKGIDVIID